MQPFPEAPPGANNPSIHQPALQPGKRTRRRPVVILMKPADYARLKALHPLFDPPLTPRQLARRLVLLSITWFEQQAALPCVSSLPGEAP